MRCHGTKGYPCGKKVHIVHGDAGLELVHCPDDDPLKCRMCGEDRRHAETLNAREEDAWTP